MISRKVFVIVLVFTSIVVLAKEQEQNKKLLNGALSIFWAQEYIGADLAKAEVLANPKSREVKFAFVEATNLKKVDKKNLTGSLSACKSTFGSPTICNDYKVARNERHEILHGNEVASLVGDPVVGVAAKAKLTVVGSNAVSEKDLLNRMLQSNIDLFCSSQVTTSTTLNIRFNTLMNQGVIVIQAAGNDYPHRGLELDPNWGIIQVSSLSPIGLVSGFSSPDSNNTIGAPSDVFVQARVGEKLVTFSGTSGAQPLVCGAVANVISLLPGITNAEVKELLVKTAIPTVNAYEEPLLSGFGMVNAYKLVKVAEAVQRDWPTNRKEIFENHQIYNFDNEVAIDLEHSRQLISQESDYSKKNETLIWLRKAFFLSPNNKIIRDQLSSLYEQNGFKVNALFYKSLGGINESGMSNLYKLKNGPIWDALIRYDRRFLPASRTRLSEIASGKFLSDPSFQDLAGHSFKKWATINAVRAAQELAFGKDEYLASEDMVRAVKIAPDGPTAVQVLDQLGFTISSDGPPGEAVHECLKRPAPIESDCVYKAIDNKGGVGGIGKFQDSCRLGNLTCG